MKNELSLSVQYASGSEHVPSRPLFRKWVKAALMVPASITVRIVDLDEGRMLNNEYRKKDYATNVLTFVYGEGTGDIVICSPVIEREASEQNKSIESHYAHMTVHGALHLQGYDHEKEDDAEIMESLEKEIMSRLGYPDPYGV